MLPNNVFHNQPKLNAEDVETIQGICSNWNKMNRWVCSKPPLADLKKAALIESLGKQRPMVIDRLLQRIYAIEKQETLKTLIK